uniref:PAS domain-containing serine/threonine-protein kinase-like n=1 Tax=Saccoglossus kowalevskii TaxID=10224 RepID=A0ABM0LXL1_SACKO|nr:PREDICTED: PAS domain-containing serine/threonine-protein kinase-like [Saccoglossus kowalevskii]
MAVQEQKIGRWSKQALSSGRLGYTLPYQRPASVSPIRDSPVRIKLGELSLNSPLGRTMPSLTRSFAGTMITSDQFGTPSYPSPLDRIRTGKRERAAQLGLSSTGNTSFELNQSFPKTDKSKYKNDEVTSPAEPLGVTLDKFTGDELNSYSFAPGHSKGSFAPSPDLNLNQSMGTSWTFYNFVGGGQSGVAFPTTVKNPNKAVCTVEARTTKILVANEMACELFGYKAEQLYGMKLSNLLSIPNQKKQEALMETYLEPSGEVVTVSGKVMEATDSTGLVIPVSLWMKQLTSSKDENPKCLTVIEPVERTSATLTFDSNGTVITADNQLAYLHGYTTSKELEGMNIKQLIPSFVLPKSGEHLEKEFRKQRATGRTKDGATFPLSVTIKSPSEHITEQDVKQHNKGTPLETLKEHPTVESEVENLSTIAQNRTPETDLGSTGGSFAKFSSTGGSSDSDKGSEKTLYTAVVWVFANISGMVSFLPDGTIHSINHNFALMLFGYSQQELVSKPITLLIPEFYDHVDMIDDSSMPLPPFDDDEDLTKPFLLPEQLYKTSPKDIDITPSNKRWKQNMDGLSTGELILEADRVIAMANESGVGSSRPESTSTADLLNTPSSVPPPDAPVSASKESGIDSPGVPPLDLTELDNVRNDHPVPISSKSEELNIKMHALGIKDSSFENMQTSNSRDCNKRTSPVCSDANEQSYNQSEHSMATPGLDELNCSTHSTETADLLRTPSPILTSPSPRSETSGSVFLHLDNMSVSSRESRSTTEPITVREAYPLKHHDRTAGHALSGEGDATVNFPVRNVSECKVDDHRRVGDATTPSKSARPDSSQLTSTPANNKVLTTSRQVSMSCSNCIPEGSFNGQARHRCGSLLGVIFQIKRVDLDDGDVLYCCWITRDPSDMAEGGRCTANITLASSMNSTFDQSALSLGEAITQTARTNSSEPEELSPGRGIYDERYETLQSIGKGAFGFVKLAVRKSDQLTVVVKFIRKSKILNDCWLEDPQLGSVPLEIALLAKLKHTNIVKMLEAYENEEFFQVIMEKHGTGIDLFEFIDRQPNLDEPLSSYMFRQVVAAISFLHNNDVLHRDIKDENIIIDEQFHIKLIDFGSATYIKKKRMFSTFCGTLEYCSPEVLLGNKYHGPELEMWSLGVTLYTLIFSENPFYDVEETIQGIIKPPFLVSTELMQLIAWLLHPEPEWRCTLIELETNDWINQRVDISQYEWNSVLPPDKQGGMELDSPDNIELEPLAIEDSDTEELEEELQRYLIAEDGESPVNDIHSTAFI